MLFFFSYSWQADIHSFSNYKADSVISIISKDVRRSQHKILFHCPPDTNMPSLKTSAEDEGVFPWHVLAFLSKNQPLSLNV